MGREGRRETRLFIDVDGARLREAGASSATVSIRDLSRAGFRTEWPYTLDLGTRVWLTLPGLEALPALVRWTKGFAIGCAFEVPMNAVVFEHLVRRIDSRAAQFLSAEQ